MDCKEPDFPPQRLLEAHARIEADLFCDQCGYNLHTQRVTRDERLGILVVRCPECGRFQPAGVASNAQKVWLARFSSILIAFWCLFLLALIFFGGLGMGGLQVAYVEGLTRGEYYSPEGVNAYRQWDAQTQQVIWYSTETQKPLQGVAPEWRRTWITRNELHRDRFGMGVAAFFMNLAPLVFGGLLATLMWHVPRRRYWMGLLIPFLAAAIIATIFHIDESDRGGNLSIAYIVIGSAAVWQAMLMLVGGFIGRPIARFLATLFVPPKPRQAIGFLWTTDGKTLPPLK